MKNLFIVIDGMDGTGKSTHLTNLHKYIFGKSKKIRILTTREPTYGKYGKKIREMLSTHNDPYSDAHLLLNLYTHDRKDHLDKLIKPFMKQDGDNVSVVLCDRYYYSTIAYQCCQGIEFEKVADRNKNFLRPDLAIILDIEPESAMKRISGERPIEKFENLEFMKKLRQNFHKMKDAFPDDNIVLIDSKGTIEETFEKIKKEVDKLFVEKTEDEVVGIYA